MTDVGEFLSTLPKGLLRYVLLQVLQFRKAYCTLLPYRGWGPQQLLTERDTVQHLHRKHWDLRWSTEIAASIVMVLAALRTSHPRALQRKGNLSLAISRNIRYIFFITLRYFALHFVQRRKSQKKRASQFHLSHLSWSNSILFSLASICFFSFSLLISMYETAAGSSNGK